MMSNTGSSNMKRSKSRFEDFLFLKKIILFFIVIDLRLNYATGTVLCYSTHYLCQTIIIIITITPQIIIIIIMNEYERK